MWNDKLFLSPDKLLYWIFFYLSFITEASEARQGMFHSPVYLIAN